MAEIDALIRDGKFDVARATLEALLKKDIPRSHRAQLALKLNRTGLAMQVVKLLHKDTAGKSKDTAQVSFEERAEYASALSFLGAHDEARLHLKMIPADRYPKKLFYEALTHTREWESKAAIELLELYLKYPLSDYDRLVAQVNLASALVDERDHVKAGELLEKLILEIKAGNHGLLLSNAYELSAANAVLNGQWETARLLLMEAQKSVGPSTSIYGFFVRKWGVLLELIESKGSPESLVKLEALKHEALERGHWETARDCDRYRSLVMKDQSLFLNLYFGTPFSSFRQKLASAFQLGSLNSSHTWKLGHSAEVAKSLDLVSLDLELKPGGLLHRTLLVLSSDFYRPIRLATIHTQLYPGEHFNPHSSPDRVHFAIKKARRWLVKQALPLAIVETQGMYRLKALGVINIVVPDKAIKQNKNDYFLHQLHTAFENRYFSPIEARQILSQSCSSLQRLFASAINSGVLKRQGKGRATRYAFSDTK